MSIVGEVDVLVVAESTNSSWRWCTWHLRVCVIFLCCCSVPLVFLKTTQQTSYVAAVECYNEFIPVHLSNGLKYIGKTRSNAK